jgi:hypothetical protein
VPLSSHGRAQCCPGWDLAALSWPAAPHCAAMQAARLRGAVLLSLSLKCRRVTILPERIASSNAGDTAGRLLPTACTQCDHMNTPIQEKTACMCVEWTGQLVAMWRCQLCAWPLTVLTCWAAGDAGCGSTAGPAAATTRSNLSTASLSRALHEYSPESVALALTYRDSLHASPHVGMERHDAVPKLG